MTDGESEHCGNCRHNAPRVHGAATPGQKRDAAFCGVRYVAIRDAIQTCCANYYVRYKSPIGPMFSNQDRRDPIPYHGMCYPARLTVSSCASCGKPSKAAGEGVEVTDAKRGVLRFCGVPHYVRWWKKMHPDEVLTWDSESARTGKDENVIFHEVQAKLELARSCLHLNNIPGAWNALAVALRDGNGAQKSRARAMLRRC